MEENIHPQQAETSILADLESSYQYETAGTGQRFLNYLIDNLLMRFGLSYLTGTIVGYLLVNIFPEFAVQLFYDQSQGMLLLLGYIIGVFNYLVYYTVCEKLFRGYTLGKLVSGTRAIREEGGELRFKDALLRTLCRIIPFEPFSALWGNPWHDTWTKTMVVKSR